MASTDGAVRPFRPPRAFLDANILFGRLDSDVLMSLAMDDVVRLRWSADVLAEARRNVLARRGDVTPDKIDKRFAAMNRARPDALVTGYRGYESVARHDTDSKDAHVLAAAVRGRCDVIVTQNVGDFRFRHSSWAALEQQDLAAFLTDQIRREPEQCARALDTMVNRWRPARSLAAVAEAYHRRGFTGLAGCLNRLADGDRDFSDVPRHGRIDVPAGVPRASAELRVNHARPAYQGIAPLRRLQPVGAAGERPYRRGDGDAGPTPGLARS